MIMYGVLPENIAVSRYAAMYSGNLYRRYNPYQNVMPYQDDMQYQNAMAYQNVMPYQEDMQYQNVMAYQNVMPYRDGMRWMRRRPFPGRRRGFCSCNLDIRRRDATC